MSRPSNELDSAWKSTCRLLLGQEIGDLEGYEENLQYLIPPIVNRTSALSGREVAVDEGFITPAQRIISSDEAEAYHKEMEKKPFDINSIKDIDSLLEAARERAYYAGNIYLGNTKNAAGSNHVFESYEVCASQQVFQSKYVAHSYIARYAENIYGCLDNVKSRFSINSYEVFESSRLVETYRTYSSSDCYYTCNLEDCQDCLFCFNLRKKNRHIGNIGLERGRFMELKTKLVQEMRQRFEKDRELPSIIDIVSEVDG